MERFCEPVDYRAIAAELERAASALLARDEDRARRLAHLAAEIREEQHLPPPLPGV